MSWRSVASLPRSGDLSDENLINIHHTRQKAMHDNGSPGQRRGRTKARRGHAGERLLPFSQVQWQWAGLQRRFGDGGLDWCCVLRQLLDELFDAYWWFGFRLGRLACGASSSRRGRVEEEADSGLDAHCRHVLIWLICLFVGLVRDDRTLQCLLGFLWVFLRQLWSIWTRWSFTKQGKTNGLELGREISR